MKSIVGNILAAFIGWVAFGCTENPPKADLLVGTYTDQESEGIYLLSFDPTTGVLSDLRLATEASSPSYLTISEDRKYVYSVGSRETSAVYAFKWKDGQDSLELINKVSAAGVNPCYVDFSESEKMVAIANYSSGSVAFYNVEKDGSLIDKPFAYQHEGSGPNKDRQEDPHAHCSIFSKDSRFIYVVDLGIDQVIAYPVQDRSVGSGSTAFELKPGDGPRHMIFHPKKNFAFIINELSNSVVSVQVNQETGKFTEVDRKSTLPEDFKAHSQCADIRITSDGKFLYASNRGHNSIAIFSVSEDAQLERIGVEPVRGDWPRNFTLSPDENFLLVANQNSNNITVFSLDKQTGQISYTGNEMALSKPVCLKF